MLGGGWTFDPLQFMQKAWFNLAVLFIIVALHWAGPDVKATLEYTLDQINQGQWWRLVSGQLLHTNTNHLLLNGVGLILLSFAFNPELNPKKDSLFFIVCLLSCGIGLALFYPYIHWYKGLSGVLHGYIIYYLFQSMRTNPQLSSLVLAIIIGKVAWEQSPFSDRSSTEALIASRVAIEIHLIGAITGVLYGSLSYCWDRFFSLKTSPVTSILDDMKWAICSPSLAATIPSNLLNSNSAWQEHQWQAFQSHWKALRKNKVTLNQLMNSYEKDRLGIYFEKLVQTWIINSASFNLIADHLQIRDSNKQTIGEFDFIVYNKEEQIHEHWEIACKFYLGVRDTSKIQNWIGPGQKDFLAHKWQHLLTKQLMLSNTPEAQAVVNSLQIEVLQKRLLLKGRLFYPLEQFLADNAHLHPPEIAPNHLQGWWTTLNQVREKIDSPYWVILQKHDWLAEKVYYFASEVISLKTLLTSVQDKFHTHPKFPIAVATISLRGNQFTETSRGFIVPENWQSEAEEQLKPFSNSRSEII